MSNLQIGLRFGEELQPRVRDELEQNFSAIQAWANQPTTEQDGSMTANQPRARYYLSTTQTFADDTYDSIVWSAVGHDILPSLAEVVQYDNGDRFGQKFLEVDGPVLTAPCAGQYLVVAGVSWAADATGRREIVIQQRLKGLWVAVAEIRQLPMTDGSRTSMQAQALLTISDARDTLPGVQVQCYQNSGGPLDILAGPSLTYLSLIKVA